jgi:hypothetical protein
MPWQRRPDHAQQTDDIGRDAYRNLPRSPITHRIVAPVFDAADRWRSHFNRSNNRRMVSAASWSVAPP